MDKTLRLQVIFGALDRLTRPVKAIQAEVKRLSGDLKTARDRVRDLGAQRARIDGFKRAKTEAGELALRLAAARERATAAGRALASADAPTRKLTADFNKAKRELGDLETKQRTAQATLNKLREEMGKAGVDTLRLAREEERVKRDLAGATAELERQKKALGEVAAKERALTAAKEKRARVREVSDRIGASGVKAVAASAAVGAPIVMAAKEAIGFQASMANVYKFEDGREVKYSEPDKRRFENDIIGEGVHLGIDAKGMGSIAGQGAAGGIHDLTELRKFARDAAMLKEALNFGSAEEAGSQLSGWRHAFNMDETAAHALGETVSGLTRRWGALHGKGAEVGEIVTNVGVLAKVAGGGAHETAALASVLSSMNVDSGVASTSIKNLMLNLTRGENATGKQKKAFKALGVDAKALAADMSRDAGPAIVSVLEKIKQLPKAEQAGALSAIFGSRSLGAIGAFLERLDRTKEALAFVQTSGRGQAMEEEFKGKTNNTAFRLEQAKANLQALAITVGTDLLPVIDRLATRAGAAMAQVRAWAQANPALTRTLVFAAVALAGLLAIGGGLTLLVAGLLGPMIALNAAFAAGSPAMLLMARASRFLGPAFGLVRSGVLGLARGFVATLPAVWSFGAALLANPITWIVAGVIALAAAVYLIIRNWSVIGPWLTKLWVQIRSAFTSGLAWLGGLASRFAEMGGHLIGGLVSGLVGGLGRVKEAVTNAGAQVIGWFKEKLGIRSPSRVFAQLGDHTMAGLTIGLDRSRRQALASVRRTAALMTLGLAAAAPAAIAARTLPARRPGAAALAVRAPAPALPARADALEAARGMTRQLQGMRAGLPEARRAPAPPLAQVAAARVRPLPELRIAPARALRAEPVRRDAPPAEVRHYEPHFHAAPGQDEQALFRQWTRWMADHERTRDARRRSTFGDYGD